MHTATLCAIFSSDLVNMLEKSACKYSANGKLIQNNNDRPAAYITNSYKPHFHRWYNTTTNSLCTKSHSDKNREFARMCNF